MTSMEQLQAAQAAYLDAWAVSLDRGRELERLAAAGLRDGTLTVPQVMEATGRERHEVDRWVGRPSPQCHAVVDVHGSNHRCTGAMDHLGPHETYDADERSYWWESGDPESLRPAGWPVP